MNWVVYALAFILAVIGATLWGSDGGVGILGGALVGLGIAGARISGELQVYNQIKNGRY